MYGSLEITHALRTHTPSHTAPSPLQEAVRRALEAARDTSLPVEPWRFYLLGADTAASVAWLSARLREPEVGPEGARAAYEQWRAVPGWIVVTCAHSEDAERLERDLEDCRTAAQRAALSLWSDHVPANWTTDVVTDDPAFYDLLDVDRERERVVGVLLYGHAESPSRPVNVVRRRP